jgi:hypothetical protein
MWSYKYSFYGLSSVICTKHWYTQHNAVWYLYTAGNGFWFNMNSVGRYSSNICSFQTVIIPHISMIHGTDKNHHCAHYKGIWRSGGTAPCILNLGTRWRLVVRFTPCLPYHCGKSPWFQLNWRLNRPYSQCACVGEQTLLSLPRMKNSLVFQPETYCYTNWAVLAVWLTVSVSSY